MNKPVIHNYNGWLVFDKPYGYSSAKLVAIVKKILKATKVGHAGTLDPLATGVLPIALGEATKTANYIVNQDKTYEFCLKFGEKKDTDDLEGETVARSDKTPTYAEILNILSIFTGEIMQRPPIFSAISINGQRAYEIARKGRDLELEPRKILIKSLELKDFNDYTREAFFQVNCGKGTYIRSLAKDIAEALGTYGHVTSLKRVAVGSFSLKHAILPEKLKELQLSSELDSVLLPVDIVLDDIPVLAINESQTQDLRFGSKLKVDLEDSDLVRAKLNQTLIALGKLHDGYFSTVRVFNY